MALVSKKNLQSVVAIGQRASQKEIERTGELMCATATGFLYGYPISGKRDDAKAGYRLWLVTCKHVIESARYSGSEDIMVRMNKSTHHGMQTFKIPLQKGLGPEWTLHPRADVAVIATSWSDLESKGVQWETFAARLNSLSQEEAASAGTSEGDEVFILGFPIGWRRGRQDYPIVRHGVLAQVQGWLNKEHDTFLVDGSGFPGNSGGPVISKPQSAVIGRALTVTDAWLMGMVSERRISPISSGEFGFAETADIIEVVPVDYIDATIQLAMQEENLE